MERHKPEVGDWYLSGGVYIEVWEVDPIMLACSVRRTPSMKPTGNQPQFYVHTWDKQHPTPDLPENWIALKPTGLPEWILPREADPTASDGARQTGGTYRAHPPGSDRPMRLEAI